MKRIALIIFIILLLTLCSCKKKDNEIATPLDIVSDGKTTFEQPENESNLENGAKLSHDDKNNTQSTEAEDEDDIQNVENEPETEVINPKVVYIKLYKSGKDYIHYIDATVYTEIFSDNSRKVVAFDGIDTSALRPTGEFITIDYMVPSPADGTYSIKKEQAEIYTLPGELVNDPYIEAVAAKPQSAESVIFFGRIKSFSQGETYHTRLCKFNRYYGEKCTKKEDLKSVTIYRERVFEENRVVITDQKTLFDIYERICLFTFDTSSYEPTDETGFSLMLEFVDGTKQNVYYTPASGRLSNYKTDEQFENYIHSFLK